MLRWTGGDTFVVEPRFVELARRQFAADEVYPMAPVEARNMKSHSHYFARLHELWMNLPEEHSAKFPTEEALRAKALVETGFCTEKDYACTSPEKAYALAAIIRAHSEYCVIKVSGKVVKVFDPVSQSVALMGGEKFEASKKAVLDYASALIPGLDQRELTKAASRHAPPEKPRQVAKTEPARENLPTTTTSPARPLPTSAAAYFAYTRAWIGSYETDRTKGRDDAWARWEGEREMRDSLRVSIPNRQQLEGLIDRAFPKEDVR